MIFVYKLLFFFTLYISIYCREYPFINTPDQEPYYVSEGEQDLILPCSFTETFRSKNLYEPNWVRFVNGTPDYITRNENVFESNGDYDLLTDIPGQYNLKIKSVDYSRDNGKFFCKLLSLKDKKQYSSNPAQIVVLLPPGDAIITSQPTRPVKENELVTFHCEVHGGNPEPEITWLFDNSSEVPSKWYRTTSNNEIHISSLQFPAAANHHKAYPICRVTNKAMKKGTYKSVNGKPLDVLHAPIVNIEPSSIYNVEEGKNVVITCLAEGNPMPTSYEWRNLATGEHFTGGKVWSFVAEKSHSGELQCTAKNSIGYGSKIVTLNVQYPPIVEVKNFINPSENDEVHLDCNVDSNPPSTRIIWTGPNNFIQEGSKLFIEKISSDQTGNYTCTASNTLTVTNTMFGLSSGESTQRQGSGTTFIEVKRKPGPATVITQATSYPVGSSFILTCSTNDIGSPFASYKWATPQTFGKYVGDITFNDAILKIENAKLSDNGIYKCVAYNNLGEGIEGKIKLTIISPPKITKPLPITRHLSSGDTKITFECEVIGYPAPSISWFINGNPINTDDILEHYWQVNSKLIKREPSDCNFCPSIVQSSLSLNHIISWTDKGNYSCIAKNGPDEISKEVLSNSIVTVQHPSKIVSKKYPIHGFAGANINEPGIISCIVSARPEPRFLWYKNGEELKNGMSTKYTIKTTQLPRKIDEYESLLTIKNVSEVDYGEYTCKTNNGRNIDEQASYTIILKKKTVPQPPTDVQILSSSSNSLLIGWLPGYDGGEKQKFNLQYIRIDPKTKNKISHPVIIQINPDNVEMMDFYAIDDTNIFPGLRIKRDTDNISNKKIKIVSYMVYNITNLLPMSTYMIGVRSENIFGQSDWSSMNHGETHETTITSLNFHIQSMKYIEEEEKLIIQTTPIKSPQNYCIMLYINDESSFNISDPKSQYSHSWHTINCFPLEETIPNIPPSRYFRTRICSKENLSLCSPSSAVLISKNQKTFEILIIILGILVVLCCGVGFVGFCCTCIGRNKMPKIKSDHVLKKKSQLVNSHRTSNSTEEEIMSKMKSGSTLEPSFTPLSSTPDSKVQSLDIHEIVKHYDNSYHSNQTVEQPQYVMLPSPSPLIESEYQLGYTRLIDDYLNSQNIARAPTTGSTDSQKMNIIAHSPTESTDETDGASYSTNGGSQRVMREIIV
ncbi:B-cell receptor CD22 [Strongyloides ratti]|uniref:B-cell receptor CD22 n=1 Tax=Strongyloides ratti TaxID=34506 RepID=A0A090KS34_STRRB|nr:B-cell receptor CD22 [Strongyloides ratti]CEF60320.1 B-cell receptor CD22 [Strongyloides ratti]